MKLYACYIYNNVVLTNLIIAYYESIVLVKDLLKSDYPQPKDVALTSSFAVYRNF